MVPGGYSKGVSACCAVGKSAREYHSVQLRPQLGDVGCLQEAAAPELRVAGDQLRPVQQEDGHAGRGRIGPGVVAGGDGSGARHCGPLDRRQFGDRVSSGVDEVVVI